MKSKSHYLMIFLLALSMCAAWSPALAAVDPPHSSICTSCHDSSKLNRSSGGFIDNSPYNMVCWDCHRFDQDLGYVKQNTHSATSTSSTGSSEAWGGAWSYDCVACHNPHYQRQRRLYGSNGTPLYPSSPKLFSATGWTVSEGLPGVYNVITLDTSPGWTVGQWKGHMLSPISKYSFFYYIVGNNTNTLYLRSSIDLRLNNVTPKTLDIFYGRLVKESINIGHSVTNSAGVSFGLSMDRGVRIFNGSGPMSLVPPGDESNPATQAVCINCHIRKPHNNIGYAVFGETFDPGVVNSDNVSHYASDTSSNYATCWSAADGCHASGEQGYAQTGAACGDCHGADMNADDDLVKQIKIGTTFATKTLVPSVYNHPKHRDRYGEGTLNCSTNGACHYKAMAPGTNDDPIGDYKTLIQFYTNSPSGGYLYNSGTYYGFKNQTDLGIMNDQFSYGGYSAGVPAATTGQSSYCANTYCHGALFATNLNGTNPVPKWNNNTVNGCGTCHKATNATPPQTGSHDKHTNTTTASDVFTPVNCATCHPHDGTIGGTTSQHVDGETDWNLNGNTLAGGDYLNSAIGYNGPTGTRSNYASCANLYCHSAGKTRQTMSAGDYNTTAWGGSPVVCSTCHRGAGQGASSWTAPHPKHVTDYGAYIECDACHVDVASGSSAINALKKSWHINKVANVTIDIANYGGSASFSEATNDCAGVSCHSAGSRGADGKGGLAYVATQDWSGTLGCDGCHKTNDIPATMRDEGNGVANMSDVHVKHLSNETTTGYGITCNRCHEETTTDGSTIAPSGLGNHANGFQNVSFDTWVGGTYASGTRQCSSVYCHSDGLTTPTYALANWTAADRWTGACGTCHNDDNTDMATGAHTKHVQTSGGYYYACYECHKDIVSSTVNSTAVPTITNTVMHVDKIRNVVFDPTPAGGLAGWDGSNCSNVYCHSNADPSAWPGGTNSYKAPTWSGTLDCNGCHNRLKDTGADWSSAHGKHVGGGIGNYSDRFSCNACHSEVAAVNNTVSNKALHSDGTKQVAMNTASGPGSWGSGNCSSVKCHSTGNRGGAEGIAYNTIGWGNGALNCKGCHYMADTKAALDALPTATALSNTHNRHIANNTGWYGNSAQGNAQINCKACHAGTTADGLTVHNGGLIKNHVDFQNGVDFAISNWSSGVNYVAPVTTDYTTSTTQCTNVYCHGDGKNFINTATWSGGTLACNGCHGWPPVEAHSSGDTNCNGCHSHVTSGAYPTTFIEIWKHVDGTIQQQGGCTNCHGYPIRTEALIICSPSANWSGRAYFSNGAGAHRQHNDYKAGWDLACTQCHAGGIASDAGGSHTAVATDLTMGFDFILTGNAAYNAPVFSNGLGLVSGGGTNAVAASGTTRTCWNTYCHSDGSGLTETSYVFRNANWDAAAGAYGCDDCHGNQAGQLVITDRHPKHVAGGSNYSYLCIECHQDTVDSGNLVPSSKVVNHVDGTEQVSFGGTYSGGGSAYGDPTCTSTYCHSQGTSNTSPYASPNTTADWSDTTLNCDECHDWNYSVAAANRISTKAHFTHIDNAPAAGRRFACAECHSATVSSGDSTGIAIANHVDRRVNVRFDNGSLNKDTQFPYYNGSDARSSVAGGAKRTPGDASVASCANVYCHSDGNLGSLTFKPSTNWDATTLLDCDGCHGSAGEAHPVYASGAAGSATANNHDKHVDGSAYGCDVCHYTTTTDISNRPDTLPTILGGGAHLNSVEDVVFRTFQGKTGDYNPAAGQKWCTNTYCHGDSPGAQWGGSSILCNGCHDATNTAGQLSNNHPVHYNSTDIGSFSTTNSSSSSGYIFGCSNCHPSDNHAKGLANSSIFQAADVNGAMLAFANYAPHIDYNAVDGKGYSYTLGTCSNTYCHSDGKAAWTQASPVVWNTTLSGCAGCHNDATTAGAGWSAAHNDHTKKYGLNANLTCAACHFDTAASNTTIVATAQGFANHVDGQRDVVFSTFAGGDPYSSPNCSNTYCHSNAAAASPSHAAVDWGTTLDTCDACHYADATATNKINTNQHYTHIDNIPAAGRRFACSECHAATSVGNTVAAIANHVDKKINVKFDNVLNRDAQSPYYNGGSTTGASGALRNPSGAAASCANVYCHSYGNLPDANNTYKTVAWDAAAIGCDGCHGSAGEAHPVYASGAAGSATANNHDKHVDGSAYGCDVCHYTTTTDISNRPDTLPTILGGGAHLNSVEDVVFRTFQGKTGDYNPAAGQKWCTNTYCHGDSPGAQWGGSSILCNGCHDATNSAGQLSNNHPVHYNSAAIGSFSTTNSSSSSGYIFGCSNCHPSDNHAKGLANSSIFQAADVNGAMLAFANYAPHIDYNAVDGKGYSYTLGTCSNTYCHSDGKAAWTQASPVVWNSTLSGCSGCHDDATDANPSWSAAHNKHTKTYGSNANLTCAACHSETAASNTTIVATAQGFANHVDGQRDVFFNTGADPLNQATDAAACANTYCHSSGQSASSYSHGAISWTDPAYSTCNECHAKDGASTSLRGFTLSQAHADHTNSTTLYACSDCHGVVVTGNTTVTSRSMHVDKIKNVDSGLSYSGGTCSTNNCHGTGPSINWATDYSSYDNCTICHGRPTLGANKSTAEYLWAPGNIGNDTSGNRGATDTDVGAHEAHLLAANLISVAVTCADCHPVPAQANSSGHLDAAVGLPADFDFSDLANKTGALSPSYDGGAYKCSNVYCHGVGTTSEPYVAVTNTDRAPTWVNTGYLGVSTNYNTNCEKCHGFPPVGYPSDHTDSMRGDGSQCSGCHEELYATGDATESGWSANGSAFVAGKRDWHINGIANAGGGGGCGGCHGYPPNSADGKTSTSGGLGSLTDGGKGAHNTVMNSHVKESLLDAATDLYGNTGTGFAECAKCHVVEGSHDGQIEISIDPAYSFKYGGTPVYNGVKGDTTKPKTCFNVLCHFTKTPRWSSGTDE